MALCCESFHMPRLWNKLPEKSFFLCDKGTEKNKLHNNIGNKNKILGCFYYLFKFI